MLQSDYLEYTSVTSSADIDKVSSGTIFHTFIEVIRGNDIKYITFIGCGSFRVRSTNGLRVTPPILTKFGTFVDNA